MRAVAEAAVQQALRAGAREAAASAARVRTVEVQWRDGQLEKITEATTRGLALELYVDGRYSAVSTSDLRPEAVERFIADAVALARTLAPDPHRGLPDPRLYQGQAAVDLQLDDPGYAAVDAPRRLELARRAEEAARAAPGAAAILSVSTGAWDQRTESVRVHSNGFLGARAATDFGVSAQVSVRDSDGRRPEDYAMAAARWAGDVGEPEAVGREAAARALGRLGSTKGPSAVQTLVVENRAAGRLVSMLLGPASAAALQQKRSFLEGRLGERLGSERLSFTDEPLVPRGMGSRLYDGEGLAAKPLALFDAGALQNYFVDVYYGRKLGMPATTRGPSNLRWKLGDRDAEGLCAEAGDGIYVTGFLGGNSNSTTGDFSAGAQGFRLRGGKLAEPLGEMNVSGNHLELWKQLAAVGNDPWRWSAMGTPTLVFEGVQVAGL